MFFHLPISSLLLLQSSPQLPILLLLFLSFPSIYLSVVTYFSSSTTVFSTISLFFYSSIFLLYFLTSCFILGSKLVSKRFLIFQTFSYSSRYVPHFPLIFQFQFHSNSSIPLSIFFIFSICSFTFTSNFFCSGLLKISLFIHLFIATFLLLSFNYNLFDNF